MEKYTMEKLNAIKRIIDEADNMRKTFFTTPPFFASERRIYEKKHSHGLITWAENGHNYSAELCVTCSGRNIYAKGNYTKDGEKTNLTTIKNSYGRMLKECRLDGGFLK